MEQRGDITQAEVFLSWTGRDRGLKDHIAGLLKGAGISCKESDESCSGDYRQWSREAVGACGIFLLILTENAMQSQYIPMELDALEKLDDFRNRIVPVCTSQRLYNEYPRPLHGFASAVFLDTLSREQADRAILQKVTDLLANRMDKVYRRASTPDYLRLVPLYSSFRTRDREYDFRRLYVCRTVTEVDDQGRDTASFDSPAELLKQEGILFIHGPGGCGKTQYINQIRECAGENNLVFSLSCAKIADTQEGLFESLYREFDRVCGSREYYTRESFRRLLSVRRTVLILDGMDEISTREGTRAFLDRVSDFYKPNMDRTTLIFTSRNRSDADLIAMGGKDVRRFRLDKLREEEIRQLGENLFLLFGSREKSTDFYVSAKSLSDEIRTNPLLLSQLAIVYQDSGKLPETLVGIWDAVSEITFRMDSGRELTRIPVEYEDMVRRKLPDILKDFAQTRYQLRSQGKKKDTEKVLSHVLKPLYGAESRARAGFLLEYLENRAILIGDEFYHKMFLEYFTAVYYYEHSFDDFDEIEDAKLITELFSHYSDPYWAQILKLYLMKADSLMDDDITEELYTLLTEECGIREYTLLLDTAQDLACHKEAVHRRLVTDILKKSTDGTYPAYGPLFWYVPEYELYEAAVMAANDLNCAKALALVRDVCVIFGHLNTLAQVTDKVDGTTLYETAKPELSGIRAALCQLFCTGTTDFQGGTDIYPRCFNVAEARAFLETGCGVFGRMGTPFQDELGLYTHESWTELEGEYIGIVSCPYDKTAIEQKLNAKSCTKLHGLVLTPTEHTTLEYIAFSRSGVALFCPPENITRLSDESKLFLPRDTDFDFWEQGGFYHPDYRKAREARLPDGIPAVCGKLFKGCAQLETVIIPDSVTVIGSRAFEGCEQLRSIQLPDGVTQIMDRAFVGCKHLEIIRIPDALTNIGEAAFANCKSLSIIRIPDGVTIIEDSLFHSCYGLEQVSLPETLTEIRDNAFFGCTSLIGLELPDTVTSLGTAAFSHSGLRSFLLPRKLLRLPERTLSNCENLTEVSFSETVLEIGDLTFRGCVSLESIQIPDSVVSLGAGAFGGCSGLTEFRVPKRITRIPRQLLLGCTKLREVMLPDTVRDIGFWAFRDCTGLERIRYYDAGNRPESGPDALDMLLEQIGWSAGESSGEIDGEAFKGCSGLTEFRIPDAVVKIGLSAFMDCTGLQTVYIPQRVTVIDSGAFENCRGLAEINLHDGIQVIGSNAFRGCTALKNLHIPGGMQEIKEKTFADCTGLTSVRIPDNIQHMAGDAFEGCTALEHISMPQWLADASPKLPQPLTVEIRPGQRSSHLEIPPGTTVIPAEAYLDHRHLETVTIPQGVTSIGDYAFEGCTGLRELYIPDTVTHIGEEAFIGCTGLKTIHLPAGLQQMELAAFNQCSALEQVAVPEGLQVIPTNCFSGCTALRQVTLPQSLTKIGASAFSGCKNLKQIRIPDGVTEIYPEVFSSCTKLTHIQLSKNIMYIDLGAFDGCTALEEITIPQSVIALDANVFNGCTNLASVTLPEGLTAIGDACFRQCHSLVKIHIPGSVTQIEDGAFYGCKSLKEITLPAGLTTLGGVTGDPDMEEYSGVFADCESLLRITIPDGVTRIHNYTFFHCAALEEIQISGAVESIGDSAFRGCGLTEVTLPDSVTRIGESAFADCAQLRQVTFSANLEEIDEFAFESCDCLEELVIPVSVRRIGRQAFGDCGNLCAVTISANFKDEIPAIFGNVNPEIFRFI